MATMLRLQTIFGRKVKPVVYSLSSQKCFTEKLLSLRAPKASTLSSGYDTQSSCSSKQFKRSRTSVAPELSSQVFRISDEIREAQTKYRSAPIVALESAIITHGMPFPDNVEIALRLEAIIRQQVYSTSTFYNCRHAYFLHIHNLCLEICMPILLTT